MADADRLLSEIEALLGRLLSHLGDEPEAIPSGLEARLRRYGRLKGERGRAAVARDLGLADSDLAAFDRALRDLERSVGKRDVGEAGARNARIAALRVYTWFETLGRHAVALTPDRDVDALIGEELGRKQVRALELVVRGLLSEQFPDQEALRERLAEMLDERIVARWQSAADPGDLLSGCSFGELASLFVSREEYARYESIFEETPFLTLLGQRRKTIQVFLDDVRRMRNRLAHHKSVTPAQLALLDLYYEELATPVQDAHDDGDTKVDPSALLEVGDAELAAWTRGLREDVLQVQDDLADLRASLEGRLGGLQADTTAIRETTRGIGRKVVGVGLGVLVLIGLGVFLALQGGRTQEEASRAREAGEVAAARVEDAGSRIEDTGRRVEESGARVEEAATETREASEDVREAAEAMRETTARVEQTLDEVRSGFAALGKQGGVIANPTLPQEHYHNARVEEAQGNAPAALASYRAYFASDDLAFVDPHLRFLDFLKLLHGQAGAREAYHDLAKDARSPAFAFAWNLLLEGDARVEGLRAFLDEHPEHAPAWYALSREYSVARRGVQTLDDKRREKEALRRFLDLEERGAVSSFYLDPTAATEVIEDARERWKALEATPEAVLENPVSLSGMRSNAGWSLTFSIPEAVKEIRYRMPDDEQFRSTGFIPGVKNHVGLPMADPTIELPLGAEKRRIEVKYVDPRGDEHGPYEVLFDPAAMLLAGAKRTLDMTRHAWLAFRDFDGRVLLYFTSLLSNRGVLEEIRYGLDREVPDRSFPLTPEDPKRPGAIDSDATIYLEVPPETSYAVVQLTFKDGTKTEVVRIDR